MRKILAMILMLIVMLPIGLAATIHGTVYDLALQPIDSKVEINTIPSQTYVTKNATYEFTLSPGRYVLMANSTEGSAYELVEVVQDGDYTIDMIVAPDIDEPIYFDQDPEIPTSNLTERLNTAGVIFGIMIVMLVAGFAVYMIARRKSSYRTLEHKDNTIHKNNVSEPNNHTTKLNSMVMDIIRKDGRTTQKEIRKSVPYSEAKISLVISELEAEGKIKKIKKGRGNILVYVKD